MGVFASICQTVSVSCQCQLSDVSAVRCQPPRLIAATPRTARGYTCVLLELWRVGFQTQFSRQCKNTSRNLTQNKNRKTYTSFVTMENINTTVMK